MWWTCVSTVLGSRVSSAAICFFRQSCGNEADHFKFAFRKAFLHTAPRPPPSALRLGLH